MGRKNFMDSTVSIIIPIYNAKDTLLRCLDSIKSQTYKCLEVLLIDDGSTDGSDKIADGYARKDPRFKCIHIQNGGVSHARNIGLDNCSGNYISFVDADDIVDARYIERLHYSVEKYNTLIARCIIQNIPPDMDVIMFENIVHVEPYKLDIKTEFDYTKNYIPGGVWGGLYHKDLVEKIRFDESITHGEDNLFVAETLSQCNDIAIIEEPLYLYVQYENSANHKVYSDKNKTEIVSWNKVLSIYEDYPMSFKVQLRAKYCKICCTQINRMLQADIIDKKWKRYVLHEARRTFPYLVLSNYSWKDKIAYGIHFISPQLFLWLRNRFK